MHALDAAATPPFPGQPLVPEAYYDYLARRWGISPEALITPTVRFHVADPVGAPSPSGYAAALWAWRSGPARWFVSSRRYAEAARAAWRTPLDPVTGWPTGVHRLIGPDPGHGPGADDGWALLAWPQTLRPLRAPLIAKRVERLGRRDATRLPPDLRVRAERAGALLRREVWTIFDPHGRILSYLWTRAYSERLRAVGVETLEDFRGQGLAQAVLGIATRDLLADGLVPFYGVRTANLASQRVAAAVGYRPIAREFILVERV